MMTSGFRLKLYDICAFLGYYAVYVTDTYGRFGKKTICSVVKSQEIQEETLSYR